MSAADPLPRTALPPLPPLRRGAGTDGPVRILTHPASAGYVQNPISVYYCSPAGGGPPARCIAEVTNTPWAERVTFAFDPSGERVRKALHVSPLMDMAGSWALEAPNPSASLKLSVLVDHPEMGRFFDARLTARRVPPGPGGRGHLRNEAAGLGCLLRYGFQPQRVAFWIYWQALVLLWKGVSFYGPPPTSGACSFRPGVEAHPGNAHPKSGCGRFFVFRDAQRWPWREAA